MTRIAFINPPWHGRTERNEPFWGIRAGSRWPFTNPGPRPAAGDSRFYSPYPFFLAYAASYAQDAGADTFFRDSIALREDYPAFYRWFEQLRPEYAVLETGAACLHHDLLLADTLNALAPGCKVILTGPVVATQGETLLHRRGIHAAVKGEYEKGVLRVLHGERGLIDFDLLSQEEMNAAPWPWLDAEHAFLYWDGNPQGQQWPHLQTWTSRGCIYKCVFCAWPANMTGNDPTGDGVRKYRTYSPVYLEAMLEDRLRRFPGYRSIYDDSDIFNFGDKHTLAMSAVYGRTKLPWSAMCRIDTVKHDTWKVMKESGCFGVKIGIESGAQEVVNDIVHKQLDLQKAVDTLGYLKELGLKVHTTFTVGLPGETADQQRRTVAFIEDLYRRGLTHTHQLSGTATIEGTPLDTLKQTGSLKKYPGAKRDEEFVDNPDGGEKLRRMTLPLA